MRIIENYFSLKLNYEQRKVPLNINLRKTNKPLKVGFMLVGKLLKAGYMRVGKSLKTSYMQIGKPLKAGLTKADFLRFIRLLLSVIFVISAVFLLSGCGKEKKSPSPEGQSSEEEQQSEKIPDDLKEIEESLEKIISYLDGPAVGIRKEENKDSIQGLKENATDKKEGESNKESQKKDEKSSEEKQEKKNDKEEEGNKKETSESEGKSTSQDASGKTQQKDPWVEITPAINKMHYTWNSYMPQALKKGASQKVLDNFSNALNSLTNTIITKDKTNTLMAANYLYAYVPDLFALYRSKSPPEIKRIRYYARNATLNSHTANWTQAELDIDNLKSIWMVLRNMIDKDKQDSINKLDLSIAELEKVIKTKNQPLADIKGRISLSNIEEIEKSLEDTLGESGSQSGA